MSYEARFTDAAGLLATDSGSFLTLPPLYHVEDVEVVVTGAGPYQATARVRVLDHADQPVAAVNVRGFWAGDLGGQSWQDDVRTDALGWATFTLNPFTPAGPTVVSFSPVYVGSDDPQDAGLRRSRRRLPAGPLLRPGGQPGPLRLGRHSLIADRPLRGSATDLRRQEKPR